MFKHRTSKQAKKDGENMAWECYGLMTKMQLVYQERCVRKDFLITACKHHVSKLNEIFTIQPIPLSPSHPPESESD